jgi:hypothetical protein
MNERSLPTWPQMADNSLAYLTSARKTVSSVRDELNSDWRPVGSSLTPQAAEARREVLRLVGEIKSLIDEAKNYLNEAR